MRIGPLRHRVTIQQVTESRTTTGAVTESWSTFATVWADISPGHTREYAAAKTINAELTHEIRIRYLEGVTPKMRILFGARVFNIDPPRNFDERNRELHIMATEKV